MDNVNYYKVYEGELPLHTESKCGEKIVVTDFAEMFPELLILRYLKFIVKSFHGSGGGLQYLDYEGKYSHYLIKNVFS